MSSVVCRRLSPFSQILDFKSVLSFNSASFSFGLIQDPVGVQLGSSWGPIRVQLGSRSVLFGFQMLLSWGPVVVCSFSHKTCTRVRHFYVRTQGHRIRGGTGQLPPKSLRNIVAKGKDLHCT